VTSSHTSTPRARLEQAFLSALGPIRQSVRGVLDRELAPLGTSIAQASPLRIIAQHDGIRQGELAVRLAIEGPTLVRMLDQLESHGLVERRPDPEDQRAKTLHLTRSGEALTRRVSPAIEAARARLLADVTDEELATCLRVFDTLRSAIEQDDSRTAT
jgi:MarR family transcriptional regulator for hemolysin